MRVFSPRHCPVMIETMNRAGGGTLGALLLWMVVGCTTVGKLPGMEPDTSVMSLWKQYVHCRANRDPDALWAESTRLRQAAHTMRTQQLIGTLPQVMETLLSDLPARWSVDPDAMAADCSLRAGLAAQERGRPQLAAALFRLIAATYSLEGYAYYVDQATRHLDQLELMGVLPGRSDVAVPVQAGDTVQELLGRNRTQTGL